MLDYVFAVIGIVDNFDESMEMFEHVFGLPFVEASSTTSTNCLALCLELRPSVA